jgi:hypothetical protein
VKLFLSGPAVPEKSDRYKKASGDERGHAKFRFAYAVVSFRQVDKDFVGDGAEDEEADEGADADAEVGEAGGALGEVVGALVDGGYGREEEVEIAVDDS